MLGNKNEWSVTDLLRFDDEVAGKFLYNIWTVEILF